MLEQHAIVLKTIGDKAWVEARESGTCGSCGSGGCSTRRLADLFGRREREIQVRNILQLHSGDHVVIGIPSGALWKSAFRLYGVPLVLMVLAALAGQHFGGDVMAILGVGCALGLSVILQRFLPASQNWGIVMLRRPNLSDGFVIRSC